MEQVREPSVSDIVGHMLGDIQRLIRDEVRLARIEMLENLRGAAMGLAAVGLAAVFGLLAIAFLGVAVFYALALVIPLWAAGLTTVGFYALLAGATLLLARSRLRPSSLIPEQTIETLREGREWLEREREWVERQVR